MPKKKASTESTPVIHGYKGFDENMQCRGMQYEVGKTYSHSGNADLCSEGLHFCENPLDVWSYYCPAKSMFAKVASEGVTPQTEQDSKRVAKTLHIENPLTLAAMIKEGSEYIFGKAKATTGCYAHSATTGDYAHSATTGASAHSATTGASAHSATTGYYAIAASLGNHGRAKARKGSWLVLAEYASGRVINVQCAQVDGEAIKADTWYQLSGGKLIEVSA